MIDVVGAAHAQYLNWQSLNLSPVALDLGFFQLRWYALSYIAMILLGWRYLLVLVSQPGAPMARRHVDDFVFYATLGVILGGRLGYSIFYQPDMWSNPIQVLKLWQGGMSFHGGFIGVMVAIILFVRQYQLDFVRVCDYIACTTPFGLFLVRLANFVNGELYGRPTDVPWAMIFPTSGDNLPRHPSQLYEAGLEGLLIGAVLYVLFWKTDARYRPGRLVGTGLVLYGVIRFSLELLRQPDKGLENLSWGLTMGQTLSIPMIVLGAYFLLRSWRGGRVEPAPVRDVP